VGRDDAFEREDRGLVLLQVCNEHSLIDSLFLEGTFNKDFKIRLIQIVSAAESRLRGFRAELRARRFSAGAEAHFRKLARLPFDLLKHSG